MKKLEYQFNNNRVERAVDFFTKSGSDVIKSKVLDPEEEKIFIFNLLVKFLNEIQSDNEINEEILNERNIQVIINYFENI